MSRKRKNILEHSNTHSRIEEDSLGKLEIPSDKAWGIRTQRFIEKQKAFIQKPIHHFPLYLKNILLLKKVILHANQDASKIDTKLTAMLVKACDDLLACPEKWSEYFQVDTMWGGGQIAVHSNVNDVILQFALKNSVDSTHDKGSQTESLRTALKSSHSTADLCHSAARISLQEKWPELLQPIKELKSTTEKLIQQFSRHKLMAKTCLQDAFEVRASLLWESFFEKILQFEEKIKFTCKATLTVSLGGTVIGTGEGASEKYQKSLPKHLSKILSIRTSLSKTPADLLSNSCDLSDIANFLWQISCTLKKMAKDIRLLSSGPSTGYHEIERAFYFEGSAFFSKKNNPIIEESILQLHLWLSSKVNLIQNSLEEQELYLNVYDSLSFFALYEIFDILLREIHLLNNFSLKELKVPSNKS